MPSYDYECKECGHSFEEFQSMKADPLVDCPSCGKPALKRLMAGGAGMIFKGSGFYLTDYKKTGSSSSSSSSSSSTSSGPDKPKDSSAANTSAKPDAPKSDK